jgi:hypothetical protein
MDAWVWIVIAAAVVVAAALIWTSSRRARTRRLRDDFGPEYDRAIQERGDRRDAEAHLREREERRETLDIRPLAPASRERYAQEWGDVQARFVDDPVGAVGEADRLVVIVMRERGYPMDDFERQAELVSVDHPTVVEDYRKGHAAFAAHDRGEASTEDLRRAMVHYRALFDELLGTGRPSEVRS